MRDLAREMVLLFSRPSGFIDLPCKISEASHTGIRVFYLQH
jgi:hypothetical protein